MKHSFGSPDPVLVRGRRFLSKSGRQPVSYPGNERLDWMPGLFVKCVDRFRVDFCKRKLVINICVIFSASLDSRKYI